MRPSSGVDLSQHWLAQPQAEVHVEAPNERLALSDSVEATEHFVDLPGTQCAGQTDLAQRRLGKLMPTAVDHPRHLTLRHHWLRWRPVGAGFVPAHEFQQPKTVARLQVQTTFVVQTACAGFAPPVSEAHGDFRRRAQVLPSRVRTPAQSALSEQVGTAPSRVAEEALTSVLSSGVYSGTISEP